MQRASGILPQEACPCESFYTDFTGKNQLFVLTCKLYNRVEYSPHLLEIHILNLVGISRFINDYCNIGHDD